MSTALPDIQLAVLDERLKAILQNMENERRDRVKMNEWMAETDRTLIGISLRLENVEANLAHNAPTLSEFVRIKHKVQGAGILGRWIWVALAGLIGFLYGAREQLLNLFSRG